MSQPYQILQVKGRTVRQPARSEFRSQPCYNMWPANNREHKTPLIKAHCKNAVRDCFDKEHVCSLSKGKRSDENVHIKL